MPRKSMDILTESMFYVLMALKSRPMCGMEIAQFIEARSHDRLKIGPATLYTILGKFEKEHYIQEISVIGRKRTYQITQTGAQAYAEELQRLKQCVLDAEGGN